MSIQTTPPSSADPTVAAPRKLRRARGHRPGLSLLAQGETMVWLTGGALAVSLTMIVGLLLLVVWCGMGTFWPVPLVRLELVDGSVVMGEVSRQQPFTLSGDVVERMSPEYAAAARILLNGRDDVTAHRRLVRTGNFELDQSHFRWVSDHEIKPAGQSNPQWGIVAERIEWGRFYGEPQGFTIQYQREIAGDEQQLKSFVEFFELNQFRLDEPQREAVETALAELREQLAAVQASQVKTFLDGLEVSGEAQWQAQIEFGDLVQLGDVQTNQNVVAVSQSWSEPAMAWQKYNQFHDEVRARRKVQKNLEKHDIGGINRLLESARLEIRQQEIDHHISLLAKVDELRSLQSQLAAFDAELSRSTRLVNELRNRFADASSLVATAGHIESLIRAELAEQAEPLNDRVQELRTSIAEAPASAQQAVAAYLEVAETAGLNTADVQVQIDRLKQQNDRFALLMRTAQGTESTLRLGDIVRAYPANQLGWIDKLGVYLSRWAEFLFDEPREANSEGGVFPAIWGTVAMTLIMSLAVVPFGVLAALYLREYATAGAIVSAVRISINNLAGVPSIVFGVFGLGFFCYIFGAYVDGGPHSAGIATVPPPLWFAGLGVLAVIGTGAFFCSLVSLTGASTGASTTKQVFGYASGALWVAATLLIAALLFGSPFFGGFFPARLPNPTFGKGGLLWSSLTLALLTLPLVIVATEESLSAVPNSMREGSYACGAGKWQTIRRIVLPQAMPGIMTGMILAMARGAGEVAPLMLVGAVKLAPELPVDGVFPFVHADRSFMHLGFHIYDLGFQSQNSEAAKPMVFTTTLLLICLIALLNVFAVWLRGRLRKRLKSSDF
jgi:ABC-type phosphate transport system permease subunit